MSVQGEPAEDADRLLHRGSGDVVRLVGQHRGVHLAVARDAKHRLAGVLQVRQVEETSIRRKSKSWSKEYSKANDHFGLVLTCLSRSCVTRPAAPRRAGVSTGLATVTKTYVRAAMWVPVDRVHFSTFCNILLKD